MKIFGLTIQRSAMNATPVRSRSFFGAVLEGFTGAWQKNMKVDPPQNLLAFSAVFACVNRIAADIGKLGISLKTYSNEIGTKNEKSPYLAVLKKPNHYQNRIKFIEQWVSSKLLYGNTYVLKERDRSGIVVKMHILDPQLVMPLMADDGSVFYSLNQDKLIGLEAPQTLPASEIIHDRHICLFHPLVGISPIYACGVSATMGNIIQRNSAEFFAGNSKPSGLLIAPGNISPEEAKRMQENWNKARQSGGGIQVMANGLKYEPMTINAGDSQLIEQLKWTVEDVARAFNVPLFKINAGPAPTYNNIEALNQAYYSDCLQTLMETIELCLDEGLELPEGMSVDFDLSGLLRMDTTARYEAHSKAIGAGWMSPNEARQAENLPPVKGGDTPYLQQQNWSLAQLDKRNIEQEPKNTDTVDTDAVIQGLQESTDEQNQ